MAKNYQKNEEKSAYEVSFKKEYQDDWDIHRDYITVFDSFEAMLIGVVYDSVSGSVDGSKITDSYAATLAKERADRVMAKLPEGETQSVGRADVGKAAFMDILRQKWIYPNANAQRPFFEKLNLWQLYSSVYGYMPMFYDWNVTNTGYAGPDCWLWNPRHLVPQQGRVSIEDMDYVTAITYISPKFIDDLLKKSDNELKEGGWDKDALAELQEKARNALSDSDSDKDTLVERQRIGQQVKRGVCLATRYEAGPDGEWISFAPDHGCAEVRRIKNPHKNGRIPFVVKYSQPLFDSFYGLGDFQRAKPLQFARDGLTNFYFKGIKMNLIPPIVANANGVIKHTLDYREGQVMMETLPNSIRRLETSTAGLNTFQAAQSMLTGSLLSQFGTQNASLPGAEALNPSQGKTPAAIDMYSNKEATRDGSERMHLETAIEQLTDGFFSMVVNIGTEDIPVSLFGDDLKAIVDAGMVDVLDLFNNLKPDTSLTAGDIKINPAKLKGVEYRFNIEPNSTQKINREKQLADFERFMDNLGKFQNMFKDDPRVNIEWGEILETYESISNIKGVKKFITFQEGPSPQELELQQKAAELEQKNMELEAKMMETVAKANEPQPVNVGGTDFMDPDIAEAAQMLE